MTPDLTVRVDDSERSSTSLGDGRVALDESFPVRALEDGEVALQEYEQGYAIFEECTLQLGVELIRFADDPNVPLISYGIPAMAPELLEQVDECYFTYFGEVDARFQTTNPDVLTHRDEEDVKFFEREARPCLDQHGIETPAVPDLQSDEMVQAMDRFFELLAQGSCG